MSKGTQTYRRRVVNRVPPSELPAKEDLSGPLHSITGIIASRNRPVESLYISQARTSKVPNRINLKAVAEVLAENGLDPTVELVKVIQSGDLDPEVKARVLGTLMEYVHSKKKSVEITGADGGAIQVENVSDDVLLRIAMQAVPADVIDV